MENGIENMHTGVHVYLFIHLFEDLYKVLVYKHQDMSPLLGLNTMYRDNWLMASHQGPKANHDGDSNKDLEKQKV